VEVLSNMLGFDKLQAALDVGRTKFYFEENIVIKLKIVV
jgi:hypothetical protein